jgi:surface protein
MGYMFRSASAFNQDISSWDVSSGINMEYMFVLASAFNQDISAWDVSSVTNMRNMFGFASAFNQDISAWDVSSVTNMDGMFSSASAFDQELCAWDSDSEELALIYNKNNKLVPKCFWRYYSRSTYTYYYCSVLRLHSIKTSLHGTSPVLPT